MLNLHQLKAEDSDDDAMINFLHPISYQILVPRGAELVPILLLKGSLPPLHGRLWPGSNASPLQGLWELSLLSLVAQVVILGQAG